MDCHLTSLFSKVIRTDYPNKLFYLKLCFGQGMLFWSCQNCKFFIIKPADSISARAPKKAFQDGELLEILSKQLAVDQRIETKIDCMIKQEDKSWWNNYWYLQIWLNTVKQSNVFDRRYAKKEDTLWHFFVVI